MSGLGDSDLHIDAERARAAYRGFVELGDELAPNQEVPLSLLGSVPELFSPRTGGHVTLQSRHGSS
jgi:hypothetical protein